MVLPSEILDPWTGLRRVGNRHQLYRSILQRFYHEYSDGAARLVKLLTSGEVEELERVAHSLKSVAGYIGADILSAQAEQLEKLRLDPLKNRF
jgi:HPt (histidine-containing phosphotransfer) domain-containing protein